MLFLLVLLALSPLRGALSPSVSANIPCEHRVFVEVSGDMTCPGVYGFCRPPDLKDLVIRAGGLSLETEEDFPYQGVLCHSGEKVDVWCNVNGTHIFEHEMSAFYKVTLGIPISINKETPEGLTAISGIGPKTAKAIVNERTKRSGFQRLDEILSVQGIGPALYRKIRPYLIL